MEGWFPSIIAQFLEGAAHPVARPSLEKQLMMGMHQDLTDMLSFYKKIIESCVLDEERKCFV